VPENLPALDARPSALRIQKRTAIFADIIQEQIGILPISEAKFMNKLIWFGLMVCHLTISASASAQSAFDGTWKFQIDKAQLSKKPDVYLLQDGIYYCKTCAPPIEVKADGQDQKVTGHPYFDTHSVKVLDDRTIEETSKKDGKLVRTSKTTVSPDGQTLTLVYTDNSTSSNTPVSGKGESVREANGPAGAHAISGSWRKTKLDFSENSLLVTFKLEGDTFSMSNPTGQSYTAKLDGTDAPYLGDPGTTTVSVKRTGKNTIEESDKRDGKIVSVASIIVAPDGKSLNIVVVDKLHGTTNEYPAQKQ
jgi:hypothetical protein